MAKVAPFHSSQNPGKYHVCSNCTEGNNIESKYREQGTGGGSLCRSSPTSQATCRRSWARRWSPPSW
jgi:hypothetical protein